MVHNNDLIVASSTALSLATLIPSWRILGRVGISRWWSFVSFVPFLGTLIVLWIIGFRAWPKLKLDAQRP
ncbi:hypothetical protein SAMN05444169_4092 [Bradyrhizobium erythrophlei]|uniref:Uncharacterized protein n=1 Tax=Bradyrhizobium erythrophlei TaxID=1437360 RepID=A0A1M5MLC0_9BRAD|nr:hypothetical protein SAMN05444169_4092 [Bradyrhizobium erythrophlei]